MRNVVCVKWGTKYSADYVNRLYGMVQRQLSLPHRFVCLTEDTAGIDSAIETLPLLRNDLKHSYTKLQLFLNPLHDIEGDILFLDLDTVILNPIDDLFLHEPNAEFIGLHEWFDDFLGSSTFRFEAGKFPFILEEWDNAVQNRFTEENTFDNATNETNLTYHDLNAFPPEVYRGDQEWITKALRDREVPIHWYPDGWLLSYKWHVQKEKPFMDAMSITFHGLPKPHQVTADWVLKNWQ
tara:strand:- start:244 stop:957 length:714 start_codon:yes stop_codon:yes gene_type:complete